MKIVILRSTSIFKDSRTSKLITELLQQKHEVLVLGWDRLNEYNDEEVFKTESGEAKIVFYNEPCPYGGGLKNVFKALRFQKWLKKQIKGLDDDYIIHACDYDTARAAIVAKSNKKLIYDIFDYFSESRRLPKPLKCYIQRKENKIINDADAVVICTEQRRKQIEGCKPKNLYIIHNTPNLNIANTKVIKSKTKLFKVAYVGVLSESRLLKEILEKSKDYRDIELHIGGIGMYSDYVKELSMNQDNVIYYGSMNYDDVLSLEKDCDLLFATYDPRSPNHKYSAPNKFYEALALGKPIIVCNDTGVDFMVKSAECGETINYDADEFYKSVISIKNDKDYYNKLCKNGLEAYKNNFSWDIMRERIRQLYSEMDEKK